MIKAAEIQETEAFFNRWSSEMAYVLGYFCADGCMFINSRGSKYIAFYSTDYELISKISKLLRTSNKIGVRRRENKNWKRSYVLQIGSKKIFSTFINLGITPAKAKRLTIPNIPNRYLRHFVRGYFDGDGCISYGYYMKKNRDRNTFFQLVRFASGSKEFLTKLSEKLAAVLKLKGGSLVKNRGGFHLSYSKNNSLKLFDFMYNNVSSQLYLIRKYRKFQQAFKLTGAVA